MVVWWALTSAVAYGASDFVGGLSSRRAGAWTVAIVGQLVSALAIGAVALVRGGSPDAGDLGWAVLAGLANGLGTTSLYRGLAAGRMGVVAPVSGVGAAVVPVLVALALGERPSLLAWIGILAAAPGIWLVSREPGSPDAAAAAAHDPRAVLDGVLAGLGFGLLFVFLAQVPDRAGLAPLALNAFVATLAVAAAAAVVGARWWPRDRSAAGGALTGLLGAVATTAYLLASQSGALSIAAVLSSLYPAFTVLLAAAVLRERVHGLQAGGLVLCGAAVVLVAAG